MRFSLFFAAQVAAFVVIMFSVASAEEPAAQAKLTLAAASKEALANNPSITSAWRKWNAMRARIKQETAWEDPKASYDSTAARFVEMAPNSMADQTLTLEQMIPVSGKNLSRGRVAAAEAVVAYEEFRRQQLDVVAKVRAAYFQLQNAETQLELNARNSASLRQIADAARAKYQSGTELAPDVLRAEVETGRIHQEQLNLELTRTEARTGLSVLMNRPTLAPISASDSERLAAPRLSEAELAGRMLDARPEIRVARAKVEAEKARLQLAKRAWIPDPAINVNTQRYNDASQAVSQLGAGISFSIPWANPGKYSSAIHEADESVKAADAELQSVKEESLGLLHDQFQRIKTDSQNYALYNETLLSQAQQAFDTTQFNYATGKAGFTDWITTLRSLREVQATTSELFTDYQRAISDLEAIVGADLPSSSPKEKKTPHHNS